MSEASQLLEQLMALIRSAGPGAFFLAMALLPAVGVPMLAFLLPVVPLFAGQLGTPVVLAIALACVTVNMTLAYVLARRGLRPLLSRWVARLGYTLPQVKAGNVVDLVIILRVTPGIPFGVQSYLAGLAEVPFRTYMLVSCIVVWPLSCAFMLFGDSLLEGNGRVIVICCGLLAALFAVRYFVRRHYAAKMRQA